MPYPTPNAMPTIWGYGNVPVGMRGAALAIGNFDGVHRGHQALLARARDIADALKCPAGAMVFDPHPRQVFQPNAPHFTLTPIRLKLTRLAACGLDVAAVIPFNTALAQLTADDFIASVLVEGWGIAHAVVGYDFSFGKDRGGTAESLRTRGAALGFGVTVVPPVAEGGVAFSSTHIREKLAAGDVRGANHLLGWRWRIEGLVTGGARRGAGLGYPTANVAPLSPLAGLKHGIYATRVHAGAGVYGGAAYFGGRPTLDNGKPILEVFLFDFDGDLYGQEIAVEFIDFIRSDAQFATPEALVAQIARDCDAALAILARDA